MAETHPSALPIGTVLKSDKYRYTIVKVLGSGGFAITYKAVARVRTGCMAVNAEFAIKEHFMDSCYRGADGLTVLCTPQSRAAVEESRRDFVDEARKLHTLCRETASIVSVNEMFEANGTAYFVMEFLDGGIPTKSSEADALCLIAEVAQALSVVHANRILHLDIKPANIVYKATEGRGACPVLIDFGIAKHFDRQGNPTTCFSVKGASVGYAPPEQYYGVSSFDPRYDIYALGAVLLYMLTGCNPPDSRHVSQSMAEIINLIPPTTSEGVRNAILHAMHPSAHARTATIRDFVLELGINAVPTSLNVGMPVVRFGPEGGNIDVEVKCDATWRYNKPASWIEIRRTPMGINIKCRPSKQYYPLQDVVIISSAHMKATVRVKQDFDVRRAQCDLVINRNGEARTVAIKAPAGWLHEVKDPWLKAEAEQDGLKVWATANVMSTPRYGSIVIKGKTTQTVIRVVQDATAITLSAYSITLDALGKAKEVKVSANSQFTVRAAQDWIKVHHGEGSIHIEANENDSGSMRIGWVSVKSEEAERRISVTQDP